MHTNPNPGAAQVGKARKGARGTGRRRAGVCPERGGVGALVNGRCRREATARRYSPTSQLPGNLLFHEKGRVLTVSRSRIKSTIDIPITFDHSRVQD